MKILESEFWGWIADFKIQKDNSEIVIFRVCYGKRGILWLIADEKGYAISYSSKLIPLSKLDELKKPFMILSEKVRNVVTIKDKLKIILENDIVNIEIPKEPHQYDGFFKQILKRI